MKQEDAIRAQEAGLFHMQTEQQRRDQRHQGMLNYRNDLAAQVQNKKTLNSIGNMTNVEKEINKQDLHAYKKFDNN